LAPTKVSLLSVIIIEVAILPSTSIIITLSNDTFVGVNGSKMDNKHYTASNVPAGLTMVITKISDTIATVTLTGTATAHAHCNTIYFKGKGIDFRRIGGI
jgi:hypothetical protein